MKKIKKSKDGQIFVTTVFENTAEKTAEYVNQLEYYIHLLTGRGQIDEWSKAQRFETISTIQDLINEIAPTWIDFALQQKETD